MNTKSDAGNNRKLTEFSLYTLYLGFVTFCQFDVGQCHNVDKVSILKNHHHHDPVVNCSFHGVCWSGNRWFMYVHRGCISLWGHAEPTDEDIGHSDHKHQQCCHVIYCTCLP